MNRSVFRRAGAGVLAVSLAVGLGGVALSQAPREGNRDGRVAWSEETRDNRGAGYGILGLVGLAGLIGLTSLFARRGDARRHASHAGHH